MVGVARGDEVEGLAADVRRAVPEQRRLAAGAAAARKRAECDAVERRERAARQHRQPRRRRVRRARVV
eukprot:5697797-Prymnesium_polylepis.1